jgi:hypothetical protein
VLFVLGSEMEYAGEDAAPVRIQQTERGLSPWLRRVSADQIGTN